MKDQIPKLMKSYAVYQFDSPGCNDSYTGKTERNLCTRTEEHACRDKENAIYDHINNCSYYSYNTKVIDFAHDWNILLIKEVLWIKQKMPKIKLWLKSI